MAEFVTWFPGLKRSKTGCDAPRLRVLCFPNAGNAEDLFTLARPADASPLLNWCRNNRAELLSVQYPGRMTRRKEPLLTDARALAEALVPVVGPTLSDGVPYVVIAHSVGTWIAVEVLRALGAPPPVSMFVSCFPAPDLPVAERPWRVSGELDDTEFVVECKTWGINDVVFEKSLWAMYRPILRADFAVFDTYEYGREEKEEQDVFHFPITAFYGTQDEVVTRAMVQGWDAHTTGPFELKAVEGKHLFPLDRKPKAEWLGEIAAVLDTLEL